MGVESAPGFEIKTGVGDQTIASHLQHNFLDLPYLYTVSGLFVLQIEPIRNFSLIFFCRCVLFADMNVGNILLGSSTVEILLGICTIAKS
ncbi:hypothetical protein J5N97_026473 [Dioscorea zingiberensis]|uniref:Uncharacterized protein n=1 Tax=Dioscorea zingiberensis TaxID=325984 RepID=A0A9D5C2V3_9LILI|nr:hypothetical protein J5N97_026473 [Dioscorea zingiberensis]